MSAVPSLHSEPPAPRLSTSRFNSGLQCHKRLWLEVHEPDALELQPDALTRFLTEQGVAVATRARTLFPGGILVERPHASRAEQIAATERAIADGSGVVFEAAFQSDGVYCAVPILERGGHGYVLLAVTSATSIQDAHVPPVALQVWVARRAGLEIERAEVLHLNAACRFPDLSDLFVREDATEHVERFLPQVPTFLAGQLAMLAGPQPAVGIGPHCREPRDCPFEGRCWKEVPPDHVTRLHGMRRVQAWELVRGWRERIGDLSPDVALTPVQERQRWALLERRLVVEPGLERALRVLRPPIAYIDFQTVGPAIPVWPGLGPWQPAPVQFSCHFEREDGTLSHLEWLALGPEDPRPELARALVEACEGARTIVVYAGSERAMMRQLAAAAPELATELGGLDTRVVNLREILANHVYAPGFAGRFDLPQVTPALVAGLSYDVLPVSDRTQASAELYRLLFDSAGMLPTERANHELELRAYAELDTLAMVKLTERLRTLSA